MCAFSCRCVRTVSLTFYFVFFLVFFSVEMFVAAVAHHYIFSADPYIQMTPTNGTRKPFMKAFLESSIPVDVIKDAREEFRPSKIFKRSSNSSSASSVSDGGDNQGEEKTKGGDVEDSFLPVEEKINIPNDL